MKKFIAGAALALLFSGPVHAGLITIEEFGGEFANQLEFSNWSATQTGSYGLEGSGSLFAGILGFSHDGLALAGSGAFAGSDRFGLIGFAETIGNVSASSRSSGFVDFVVGHNPIELLLTTMLYGDASFEWVLSRNGEYLDGTSWFASGDRLSFAWNGYVSSGAYGFGLSAVNATAVPEPGTWSLLVAGLIGLLFINRRQREVAI